MQIFVKVITLVLVLSLLAGCTQTPPAITPTPTPLISVASSPSPIPTVVATPSASPTAAETSGDVHITIVYDNLAHDSHLQTGWGFAALVEYGDQTLLFDTGADGATLLGNMKSLGVEPTRIQQVVLSHFHSDHVEGLRSLLALGGHPTVYVPPSFPSDFKRLVQSSAKLVEVTPGQELAKGIFASGEITGDPFEQALVIRTTSGLVILTGCAHPGIVKMLTQIKERFNEPIRLVLGGFHLVDKSESQIGSISDDFDRLGVAQVSATHCTGDNAIAKFAAKYGDNFVRAGVGRVIIVKPLAAGKQTAPSPLVEK